LKISKDEIKSGAYIDFYANDNDWKYYTVSNVHCGRVRVNASFCFCNKEHIDLRPNVKYTSQFESWPGKKLASNIACCETCRYILKNSGLDESSGANTFGNYYVAKENKNATDKKDQCKYIEVDSKIALEALEYIDEQLNAGYPILVGVDHTHRDQKTSGKDHNEGITDHFIVIVGRGCTDNEAYYFFYEVGTAQKENGEYKGKHDNNKLYLKADHSLRGSPYHNSNRKYVVTQVRLNVWK
jgi:hypothetical protein